MSIKKARSRILQKEVSVSEYLLFLREHPHYRALGDLKCLECGDEITICNGDINQPYFKHKPLHEGHVCPLYTGCTYTKSHTLVKKFLDENDITFKFELLYRFGKWNSVIALPAFTPLEIKNYSSNNTHLKIKINNSESLSSSFFINEETINPGKIKTFCFGKVARNISIEVKGEDETKAEVNKFFDGFKPDEQIYENLVDLDYSENNQIIDLTNIKTLVFKRTSGNIYLGRHYIVFINNGIFNNITRTFNNLGSGATIRALKLKVSPVDNYFAYDVVFNKINEKTESFCEDRYCRLSENYQAEVVWPPVNTIGNYKNILLDKNNLKHFREMFILCGNDKTSYDLLWLNRPKTTEFVSIHHKISKSFYLTSKIEELECVSPFELHSYDLTQFVSSLNTFKFKNGVLIEKLSPKSKTVITNSDNFLDLEYRLCPKMYFNSKQDKDNKLLDLIRYSLGYEAFTLDDYEIIKKKNPNNKLLLDYIEFCKDTNQIKKGIKNKYM